MPDRLRKMVREFDRANARPHRLTGEPILPPRGDSSKRKVCGSCWHIVDEAAEQLAWRKQVRCKVGQGPSLGGKGCFFQLNGDCHKHPFPGVNACPRCGGTIEEVTI